MAIIRELRRGPLTAVQHDAEHAGDLLAAGKSLGVPLVITGTIAVWPGAKVHATMRSYLASASMRVTETKSGLVVSVAAPHAPILHSDRISGMKEATDEVCRAAGRKLLDAMAERPGQLPPGIDNAETVTRRTKGDLQACESLREAEIHPEAILAGQRLRCLEGSYTACQLWACSPTHPVERPDDPVVSGTSSSPQRAVIAHDLAATVLLTARAPSG